MRALSCALFALGATVSCGDMGLFSDQCATDADCSAGQGCNQGLTKTCEVRCERHEQCAPGEFCDSDALLASFPHCTPGCRSDAECTGGLICENGICQEGCRKDSDCPVGQACAGTCIVGCRDDSECSDGASCVCHRCSTPSCRSDADCADGAYCPITVFSGGECNAAHCTPLPPPVQCGQSTCRSKAVSGGVAVMAVSPCCVGDSCGLEITAGNPTVTTCELPAQPGVSDPNCPSITDATFTVLSGCRRPDGACGYLADALGLGCIAQRGSP